MTTIYLKSAGIATLAAAIAAVLWELGTLTVGWLLIQRAIAAEGQNGGIGAVSVPDLTPLDVVATFGFAFWLTPRRLRRREATRR
jgi:hypothetical protein